ncbi:TPA: dTDP-4-dehydrorhamnose reductase [Legionella pneumophila]|uniref:dTDP-4-dehydrorhamnose reductase n=1 Tax=Legionella pneumophila subsp. pascullei TaxID=91890 RepID=A0AAX2IXU3_LEGPN|nr:dTDP-4-dehydrorhamnose reductase [Legionella pneumophila]HAT9115405.1 dTDP-4-dehydrorhamnose reductase [Legionella pneumophila subsp. pneumophila]AMP91783.1 NAD(P)-dependent oxidoreductase [Legionella pneumophila subsp. pascullei]APF05596.1 dTDP-4-dehydrorhamnose reductase [Legionella pneumophila subsp. fraseri]SQG89599.1 dTDP-6-deoxy-L-mannose dehydrogenase RmlD [Legionella pneumophila subsp. pascullei]VEH05030.1 dTDP-6-deoxy-L-mannose dehydrogenase RmlD [Legionella pneumophila subsp. pasc
MKILVTGAKGQVGTEIVKYFSSSEHEVYACTRDILDCCKLDQVHDVLLEIEPDLIINAAAYTAVDMAEDESDLAHIVNAEFVSRLVNYCSLKNIPLLHLSTDYVFDGEKNGSYHETDNPNPLSAYGRTKWEGEQAILSQLKQYIILRVSWVFGKQGKNFVKTILSLASSRKELNIVADQWGRPTSARDIARVLFEIVQKISHSSFEYWGIYHYAGQGVTNWYEFANAFLKIAKEKRLLLTLNNLNPIKTEEYPTKAIRPKNSVLDTTKIETILGIKSCSWKNDLPDVIDNFTKK